MSKEPFDTKTLNKESLSFFLQDLQALSIELSDTQLKQFMDYYQLLVSWNSFMNLTAITEFQEVCKKHFIDSLSLIFAFPELSRSAATVIDVGTGAGFPGIPLKIAFPDLKVTLLDSLNKRVVFLNQVIQDLSLSDIVALHGRAEDYAKNEQYRESYDLCVSRAVSNMTTLSEYCIPFVKIGGCFICYKSEKVAEEYERARSAIDILGGKLERQSEFMLPDSDIYRNLFVIMKEKSTPLKYPRKAGLPQKDPLL